jgi:hypothetical protein
MVPVRSECQLLTCCPRLPGIRKLKCCQSCTDPCVPLMHRVVHLLCHIRPRTGAQLAHATFMKAQRSSCTFVNASSGSSYQPHCRSKPQKPNQQVPSNMALVRVGGALWLGVIVTLWGIVATCFAGLSSATMCGSSKGISCAGRTSKL